MKRANLKFTTIHQYAKNSFTIFEQQGTWLNDDGTIKGQAIVFTVFRVVNRKVTFLARMDNKEVAFDLSGLSDVNKVNQNSL
ncbi:hypothetical protein [Halalkalibacter okhensis]|uniref:hypothetical protein n=1 Tax=Halalkalibacter okhensis TaxID=333138 RepID=UPI000691A97E|nr:hypothetical protein [Halalkalibacter okhensis]